MTDTPQDPQPGQTTNPERPQLRYEDGYTVALIKVTLNKGIRLRTAAHIWKECMGYSGEVYFRHGSYLGKIHSKPITPSKRKRGLWGEGGLFEENPTKGLINAKYLMSISTSGLSKGSILEVMVQGTDEKAKKQTLALCSGLLSEDSYELNFNKFDK